MGLLFTLIFLSPLFLLSSASAAELNTTRRALAGAANCNIFLSKWVYDASYPLYDFSSCPSIDDQFNCLKYRCPDRNYLKYRWQPFSCNLARQTKVAEEAMDEPRKLLRSQRSPRESNG
ncbi:hypothetical protein SASPL_108444 [Salvia splendens]|uniref:Trichome birefringence-like N-terminal domain-containing protein n=1 Tax=Salvia splendens TaxID=180675 RepID=A0A8X9A899_SALSN|nr:hypothetical protein SASPL_108444 [Salvia splendens]